VQTRFKRSLRTGIAAAVAGYRQLFSDRGLRRVEVKVRSEDAALVRAVASALTDPACAQEVRAVLRNRFLPRSPGRA
jgi:hypothetical protein